MTSQVDAVRNRRGYALLIYIAFCIIFTGQSQMECTSQSIHLSHPVSMLTHFNSFIVKRCTPSVRHPTGSIPDTVRKRCDYCIQTPIIVCMLMTSTSSTAVCRQRRSPNIILIFSGRLFFSLLLLFRSNEP